MKIIFEKEKCIGCGSCSSLCSDHWEMGEDGKVILKEGVKNEESGYFEKEVTEEGCNKDAEKNCPVMCIHVIKKD